MSPSAYNGDGPSIDANGSHQKRALAPGIYVPTLAFFDPETDELDTKTVTKHAVRLAKSGVTGLAVQGSNGEAVHLTFEERARVTSATRSALDGAGFDDMPLIVGCGAQSTFEAISLCKQAAANGGDYALVLPPSYYSGLFDKETVVSYFNEVADKSPVPIIIYNYPGATPGLDLNSDTLITLSKHDNIIGCKFTCGNTGKLSRVASATKSSGTNFLCFSGSFDFTLPSIAAGGSGVIGGLGNVTPCAGVRLWDLAMDAKRADEARELQRVVAEGDWMMIQTGVVGVKAALRDGYGYGGWARRPLPRLGEEKVAWIRDGMKALLDVEKELESS
ncbi:aldolase [Sarocladium strictum]